MPFKNLAMSRHSRICEEGLFGRRVRMPLISNRTQPQLTQGGIENVSVSDDCPPVSQRNPLLRSLTLEYSEHVRHISLLHIRLISSRDGDHVCS